jgi:hypothetical protein
MYLSTYAVKPAVSRPVISGPSDHQAAHATSPAVTVPRRTRYALDMGSVCGAAATLAGEIRHPQLARPLIAAIRTAAWHPAHTAGSAA